MLGFWQSSRKTPRSGCSGRRPGRFGSGSEGGGERRGVFPVGSGSGGRHRVGSGGGSDRGGARGDFGGRGAAGGWAPRSLWLPKSLRRRTLEPLRQPERLQRSALHLVLAWVGAWWATAEANLASRSARGGRCGGSGCRSDLGGRRSGLCWVSVGTIVDRCSHFWGSAGSGGLLAWFSWVIRATGRFRQRTSRAANPAVDLPGTDVLCSRLHSKGGDMFLRRSRPTARPKDAVHARRPLLLHALVIAAACLLALAACNDSAPFAVPSPFVEEPAAWGGCP